MFIYLFIQRRLSTQDKITKQQQNDNVTAHSKVPIKVQNKQNIIEISYIHPEAQQGLVHLNGRFATRLMTPKYYRRTGDINNNNKNGPRKMVNLNCVSFLSCTYVP